MGVRLNWLHRSLVMRRDPYPFTTAPNVEPFNKPPVRDWARDHLWRHPEILRALELPVTRQKRVGLGGCAGAVLFGGDGTTDRARRSIGWAEAVPIVARVISVATDTRLRIMAMASNLNRQTDSLGKPEIALRVGDQLAASCFLSRGRSTSPVTFPGGRGLRPFSGDLRCIRRPFGRWCCREPSRADA